MWDPATGTFTPVNLTGYNVFCSGLAHLLDGSLFLAGGNKNDQLEGIAQTHVFDSDTNTWSRGADMAEDRWYPTVTPLHNGELLITAGGPEVPEVRQTDGALRALDTASLSLPLYPWIDVAPDGRAFYSGPEPTLRSLDPAGGGSWQTFGRRDSLWRGYGSHVMYDRGQDPGRRRTALEQGFPRHRPERGDAADIVHGADGVRPPPAQPHRAGGRQRARDRRPFVRGRARGHEQRRLPGRALEPRHRAMADARGDAGDPPIPLHSAPVARRARAVLGRWRLRRLRRAGLPGEERRSLLPALPVQE